MKKGTRSAGVQRQYSGTAGRTENCQIGVFLAYASARGHALIDRELYLPASWAQDRDRCRTAGIPGDIGFSTKAQLAQVMLERALGAGVPFAWFTADELYGQAHYLRAWLEDQDVAYVMATRCNDIFAAGGTGRRADALIAALPARSWQRLSVGAGAHGPREYHWARIRIPGPDGPGRAHWLLARRSLSDPGQIAYYACYGPARTRLVDLAWVAGSRWHIEECLCATRRSAVFPAQPGGTWREVSGSDGLPGAERLMGTRACQETSGRAQALGAVRWGTRATW